MLVRSGLVNVSNKDFAETAWNIKRFAWSPLGLTGMQRSYWLAKVMTHAGMDEHAVEQIRAAG